MAINAECMALTVGRYLGEPLHVCHNDPWTLLPSLSEISATAWAKIAAGFACVLWVFTRLMKSLLELEPLDDEVGSVQPEMEERTEPRHIKE